MVGMGDGGWVFRLGIVCGWSGGSMVGGVVGMVPGAAQCCLVLSQRLGMIAAASSWMIEPRRVAHHLASQLPGFSSPLQRSVLQQAYPNGWHELGSA